MHTVGWLELNEERKANDMFKMLLRNINGPFKVKHTYLSIIMFNLSIDVLWIYHILIFSLIDVLFCSQIGTRIFCVILGMTTFRPACILANIKKTIKIRYKNIIPNMKMNCIILKSKKKLCHISIRHPNFKC